MINVTKSFLPDINEYIPYLQKIWDSSHLTNNGPMVVELEKQLKDYLKVDQFYFCTNGTIVLQIALKAFNITKEVITTPFSYCATSNAIIWENCKPVFVDIQADTFNIDPAKIEAAITPDTQAILATHVYGNPCDVEAIETIAKKHNLVVIYDAAHAFGVVYKGKSLFSFGDVATCSFHATKVFHTVEGGALIVNTADEELSQKFKLMRAFGHDDSNYYFVGVNGKNSEFHAAMGLCNLPHFPSVVASRKQVFSWYDAALNWQYLTKPKLAEGMDYYNYAYYPIVFESEAKLLDAVAILKAEGINARRYFYPSLNNLSFLPTYYPCPVSEDIAKRVLALPLYHDIESEVVAKIAQLVNSILHP